MNAEVKSYEGKLNAAGLRFGIVCARFNEFFTSKLLGGALDTLLRHGAAAKSIETAWVPGSFEIPLIAQNMAASGKYDAIIALGVVIQGSTAHANYVKVEWTVNGEKQDTLTTQGLVKGPNIPDVFKSYKIRTDYRKDKDDYIFDFQKPKAVGKTACTDVRINFSDTYYSTFTYDKSKKAYFKTHTGKPHMDARANEQLHYTNVFVLETDVGLYKNGPLVHMEWKGGTGYYLSYGTVRKVKWSKKTFADTISVTDSKGNNIPVNRGNSYIAVTGYNTTVFPE